MVYHSKLCIQRDLQNKIIRTMNIIFLLVFLNLILPPLSSLSVNPHTASSKYPSGLDRLLARKKRFLLFPPKAGVACIFSMVKAIIFSEPTGYNTISEMEFVYPLPDAGFYMKKHKKFWTKNRKTTKKPAVMQKEVISWTNPSKFAWNTWSPVKKFTRSTAAQNYSIGGVEYQFENDITKVSELMNPYQDEYDEFRQRRSYRERRDFYRSIENMINKVNFKPINRHCILKTICEAQHFLLPKGKSLFHDLFRILFTIPMTTTTSAEYRNAMNLEEHQCDLFFRDKCPISILELFLNSDKLEFQ